MPESGWTKAEQKDVLRNLAFYLEQDTNIVFLSLVPVLLMWAPNLSGIHCQSRPGEVLVFHNDKREKKELPNGKVIMTVAQTGWELVGWEGLQ